MATTPANVTSASVAVFNTVELLEAILMRVDAKTVLLSQRVNKTFQATMIGSPKLQEALFFRSKPATSKILQDALFFGPGSESRVSFNELLMHHELQIGMGRWIKLHAGPISIDYGTRRPRYQLWVEHNLFGLIDDATSGRERCESWQNMYLRTAMEKAVNVDLYFDDYGLEEYGSWSWAHSDCGMTVGELVDVILETVRKIQERRREAGKPY